MKGLSDALLHPTVGTAGIVAVMGYLVVFFGLTLLLVVVTVLGRIMVRSKTAPGASAAPKTAAPPAPAAVPAEKSKARGAAGELKLYNVSERDAAIVMAVVAHRLGRPVNELRFRSIKEVEEK